MRATIRSLPLKFKFPAGTSRGILTEKPCWFICLNQDDGTPAGIGEVGYLPGLSFEDQDHLLHKLTTSLEEYNRTGVLNPNDFLEQPSLRFAWEMALKDKSLGGKQLLFPSAFTQGEIGIPINGLIWMNEKYEMLKQIEKKLDEGYRCIKIKIGAIDFNDELDLLSFIRQSFPEKDLQIRVDANGAFKFREAVEKLKRLADYSIHSIEQPIKPGQYELMMNLCEQLIIPIALDEELIGIFDPDEKHRLLQMIRPQFIILKPSLLGGWQASEEWILAADSLGIDWWATSALESNIGLNAISQWAYSRKPDYIHGLGTGALYHNNIESPLYIRQAALWFDNRSSFHFKDA